MATIHRKHVKSKYFGVSGHSSSNTNDEENVKWFISLSGYGKNRYNTEKECAIAVDKILIEKGKEPVNILKRK